MSERPEIRLVKRERTYYFVGAIHREIVFTAIAAEIDEAWAYFRTSKEADTSILFVIKTETEIYLSQGK